jgi:hypothetical protein
MLHDRKAVRAIALGLTAILLSAAPAQADAILLSLTDAPIQTNTPYALVFTATASSTTLSVAGYQRPSAETASQNGVFLNGGGANLLAQTWSLTPAASGSGAYQYSDGSSVNLLYLEGISPGYSDTFSQTIATTAGSAYTYDFMFSEQFTGPSFFQVSASGMAGAVAAAVPEPASVALFGAGLAALGWMRRRKTA